MGVLIQGPKFSWKHWGNPKIFVAWIGKGEVRYSVGLKTHQLVLHLKMRQGPTWLWKTLSPYFLALFGAQDSTSTLGVGEAEVARIHGVVHRHPSAPTPLPTSLSLRGEQDVLALYSLQQ